MLADQGRLQSEGRRVPRTRVDDGGRYLGIPRHEDFSPFRSDVNHHPNPSPLRGPILDNREHLLGWIFEPADPLTWDQPPDCLRGY